MAQQWEAARDEIKEKIEVRRFIEQGWVRLNPDNGDT
jgi:GH15 family glucan-1,4-alpha-glucosidase